MKLLLAIISIAIATTAYSQEVEGLTKFLSWAKPGVKPGPNDAQQKLSVIVCANPDYNGALAPGQQKGGPDTKPFWICDEKCSVNFKSPGGKVTSKQLADAGFTPINEIYVYGYLPSKKDAKNVNIPEWKITVCQRGAFLMCPSTIECTCEKAEPKYTYAVSRLQYLGSDGNLHELAFGEFFSVAPPSKK
jgi:hypothetical protein